MNPARPRHMSSLFLAVVSFAGAVSCGKSSSNNTIPDLVIQKSSNCSFVGTYFEGIRSRFTCDPASQIVSANVFAVRQAAARTTTFIEAARKDILNQSNASNVSLTNNTLLEIIGRSLVNESNILLPCREETYLETLCACPLDRTGGSCNLLKTSTCTFDWVAPNIKECLDSNGRSLSKTTLDFYRYNVELDGIPPCVEFDVNANEHLEWQINLDCSFIGTFPRMCNGSASALTSDTFFSKGCLEDQIPHWYNNNKSGSAAWAIENKKSVAPELGDSQVLIKFYSMYNYLSDTAVFASKSLTGAELDGPYNVSISIDPRSVKEQIKRIASGQFYFEGVLAVNENLFVRKWAAGNPSFMTAILKGYVEPQDTSTQLGGGFIFLIVLGSLLFLGGITYLLFIKRKCGKDKGE